MPIDKPRRAYSQFVDENVGYGKLKGNVGPGLLARPFINSQFARSNKEVIKRPSRVQKATILFNYDATQSKNPDAVSEFAMEIFEYMKAREKAFFIPDYICKVGAQITEYCRALIVNWLCETQQMFCFCHEIVYIAVHLFDRYMSQNWGTPMFKLQLVAASAFLIASKYEEHDYILISDLEIRCAYEFDRSEFMYMEREILKTAGFDVGFPLSYSFLRRFARVIGADLYILTLARFILEVSLHYYSNIFEFPSKLAAAALVLALKVKKPYERAWIPAFEHYSGHAVSSLQSLVETLNNQVVNFKNGLSKSSVIEKYSEIMFFEVAKVFYG